MSSAMTPDRWRRMSELFERALALSETERETLIDAECAGDTDLARQLRSLLEMQPRAEGFLENAADVFSPLLATPGESDPDAFPDGLVGKRIAGYRIIKQIGQGGMGVVYLAEQLKPRRTVALKIFRAGLASPSVLKRFEHEAHILGRLQHPGIAQIYEAGAADESGAAGVRGFFAMEYVRGRTLSEHIANAKPSTRERLDLLARIADAVQHAHTKGVIHRDLKPSNILIDDRGQPKILDFGVARATDGDIHVTTLRTSVGQLIGTLPYMSPEQVVGDPGDIDTRSDVYALGVILYETLIGRLPHDLKSRSVPEAARIIRDEEPARLSAVDKTLRGDIETIVLKALEKNKANRYQSAAEFADDIRRFLAGEPIGARRDSAMYVLKQQIRRYRGAAGVAAIFILGLFAFAVYAARQSTLNELLARRESLAKGEAIAARERAEAEKQRADAESERLRRELYFGRIGYSEAALAQGDVSRVRRLLADCPEDLRRWEWGFFEAASDQSARHLTARLPGWGAGAFGPNSEVVVTLRIGEEAVVRDAASGAERYHIAAAGGFMDAELSHEGRWLMLFGQKGEVYLQDLQSPEPAAPRVWKTFEQMPRHARFDEASKRVAIINGAGDAIVFDLETGAEIRRIEGQNLLALDLASDGSLIIGDAAGKVYLAAPEGLVPLGAHEDSVRELAFDPTGKRAASAGNDGAVRVWDLASRSQQWVTRAFKNKAAAVAWSPDARIIYSGGTEARLKALDAQTGNELWEGLGHTSTILDICVLQSGEALSTGIDGELRWWTAESVANAERAVRLGENLLRVAPLSDGFIVSDWNGAITGIDADGRVRPLLEADGKTGFGLAALPGGFARAIGQEHVAAHDLPRAGERWRALEGHGKINGLAASPDGGFIAVTVAEGSVHILSVGDGSVLASTLVHPEGAQLAQWSPDGARLYTTGTFGILRSWTWDKSSHTLTLEKEQDFSMNGVWTMSISPDGSRLLLGGDDSGAWLIDTATFTGRELIGHQGAVYASAFHPDSSRVVTGGFDNTTRIWDTATGAEVVVLRSHKFSIHGIAFDPSGRVMLTIGGDGLGILRRGGVSSPITTRD